MQNLGTCKSKNFYIHATDRNATKDELNGTVKKGNFTLKILYFIRRIPDVYFSS